MTTKSEKRLLTYSLIFLLVGFLVGSVLGPAITGWASKRAATNSGPFLIKTSNTEPPGPSGKNSNHCIAGDDRSHAFCCTGWGDWRVRGCEQAGGNVCEIVDVSQDWGSCTTIIPDNRQNNANRVI